MGPCNKGINTEESVEGLVEFNNLRSTSVRSHAYQHFVVISFYILYLSIFYFLKFNSNFIRALKVESKIQMGNSFLHFWLPSDLYKIFVSFL